MIVGDFEFYVSDGKPKTATIRKKHECFELNEDDIYRLGFIIEDIKRRLNLKRLM